MKLRTIFRFCVAEDVKSDKQFDKNTLTANARFGATAAGSAELKCRAKMQPLRQAAIPLGESRERAVQKDAKVDKKIALT